MGRTIASGSSDRAEHGHARYPAGMRLPAIPLFVLLLGCPQASSTTSPEPTLPEASPVDLPLSALVGEWRTYADPGDDWESEPLDDARWMHASAELACVGRAHHGAPDRHRVALRQVLAHHRTTAAAVMDYGVLVNEDGTRALELGAQVAQAAQTCR